MTKTKEDLKRYLTERIQYYLIGGNLLLESYRFEAMMLPDFLNEENYQMLSQAIDLDLLEDHFQNLDPQGLFDLFVHNSYIRGHGSIHQAKTVSYAINLLNRLISKGFLKGLSLSLLHQLIEVHHKDWDQPEGLDLAKVKSQSLLLMLVLISQVEDLSFDEYMVNSYYYYPGKTIEELRERYHNEVTLVHKLI